MSILNVSDLIIDFNISPIKCYFWIKYSRDDKEQNVIMVDCRRVFKMWLQNGGKILYGTDLSYDLFNNEHLGSYRPSSDRKPRAARMNTDSIL